MSDEKHDWLFSGVVDGGNLALPRDPFQLGGFEITRWLDPFPGVAEALNTSLSAFGYDTSRAHLRMSTLVGYCTRAEARRQGTLFAREALMLFRNSNVFVQRLRLLEAGYLMRMSDRAAVPLLPSATANLIGPFMMFDEHLTHPAHILNLLMRMPPERYGQLGAAVRRSAHWADLASRTEDLAEQLFMQWVSIECLCRVDPNESINAKVATAARFPSGRFEVVLPVDERAAIAALPNYREWRRRVTELINKLRDLRNDIAHGGFRELDVRARLDEREIYLARRLLAFAYQGVGTLTLHALERGITTIAEMWDRYAECLLPRRQISIARELSGTIIYTFENPVEFE